MSNNLDASVFETPGVTLGMIRAKDDANSYEGRGQETAAGRGYNAERLARGVLASESLYSLDSTESWYDSHVPAEGDKEYWVEAKSCIKRYPSSGYGRFRIWKRNHDTFVEEAESRCDDNVIFLYFFVVYTIERGRAKEVGKLAAPLSAVDAVLNSWSRRDHYSMGRAAARDISWRVLLRELGVPRKQFEQADATDLTLRYSNTN